MLNAAGPWVDDVLQATGRPMRPRLRAVRGTHVVLDLEGRGPSHALLARGRRGEEPLLVVPWLGLHIVGVAESPAEGNAPSGRGRSRTRSMSCSTPPTACCRASA